jgi:hypothetical protein
MFFVKSAYLKGTMLMLPSGPKPAEKDFLRLMV